jgi:fructokinase
MDQTAGRVVVVGDALIDEIRTPAGSDDHVGGAGLNVAVGLARLGVPTTLLASVGDDADGAAIRAHLAEHGVELVATVNPLGTGRAVSERVDGEPSYSFTPAAVARGLDFSAAQVAAIAVAPLVAVSSYPFDDARLTERLLQLVGAEPPRLVVDPNPRPGFLRDVDDFRAGFARAAAVSLLVKIGSDDAELVAGTSLEGWQEALLAAGAGSVLATRGADGADLQLAGGPVLHRDVAVTPGEVVDTMGAGDATFASIVASLLAGTRDAGSTDWGSALADAMAVAAATVRAPGALLRRPGGDR